MAFSWPLPFDSCPFSFPAEEKMEAKWSVWAHRETPPLRGSKAPRPLFLSENLVVAAVVLRQGRETLLAATQSRPGRGGLCGANSQPDTDVSGRSFFSRTAARTFLFTSQFAALLLSLVSGKCCLGLDAMIAVSFSSSLSFVGQSRPFPSFFQSSSFLLRRVL